MNKPSLFEISAITRAIPASADAAAARPATKLVRRKPSPLALEQRFMFDGAAVGDAVQLASGPEFSAHDQMPAADLFRFTDTSTAGAPTLMAAEAEAQRLVAEFLQRPDARAQLFGLFNGGQLEPSAEWLQSADSFLTAMRKGEISVRVELRS
ncbi:MAG: hypothetical protein K9K35_10320, partial [Rhodoferax sp.]|nr:hypothetical protein [Rhodoferax sp.]